MVNRVWISALAGTALVIGAARASFADSNSTNRDRWSGLPASVQAVLTKARLSALDGKSGDGFGFSTAISGDTIVVGTPFPSVGANDRQGVAYVFVKPAGGWASTSTFTARLTASDGGESDQFGQSVAISGDTIAIGALGVNGFQGAVYIFTKPPGGWTTTSHFAAKLTASDGAFPDALGLSVSMDGDTVVAGAPGAAIGPKDSQGAAYVFVKKAAGWASTSHFNAKLTASDGQTHDEFGDSVAISGGTIVAGSPTAKVGANENQGAMYVFVKPLSGWATTSAFKAKLTASDGIAGDELGSQVAISGDVVISGIPSARVGGNSSQGAIDVFVMPESGWISTSTFTEKLTALDGVPGTALGGSLAISGDTIIASAVESGFGSDAYVGDLYVFNRPPAGWGTGLPFESKVEAPEDVAGSSFGFSVAISGETSVVGAANATIGPNKFQGAAYVFEGSASSCGDSLPSGERGCVGPLSGFVFTSVNGR